MLAFVTAIGDWSRYERCAKTGIDRNWSSGDALFVLESVTCLATAYNQVLDEVADLEALEGVVFLHDDVEIVGTSFRGQVRDWAFEKNAGILGVVGARGVFSIAWWLGSGVGRVTESRGQIDFGSVRGDVDCVDGMLLVFSPWAARNVRFDPVVAPAFHGYDVDACFTARNLGGRVAVAEIDLIHHTKGGFGDRLTWIRADLRWRAKWDPQQTPGARVRHWLRLVRVYVSGARDARVNFDGAPLGATSGQ